MVTPGATPLWTAFSRPKLFGVAPGATDRLRSDVLAACIQRSKQSRMQRLKDSDYRKDQTAMPVLKAPPKQPKTTVVQLRLDEEARRTLTKYAEYLECSPSHVVTEALKLVHRKDKEFQSWLSGRHTKTSEPKSRTALKGASIQLELK